MARLLNPTESSSLYHPRRRGRVLLLGLLLLLLAHGVALIFRIQPAVSLWFPPSGVAIALTLWLGPIGALLTWITSFTVAPLWGSDGWARFASVTDAIEPLVAWLVFYRCFQASLSPRTLWNATAFLISAPLIACGTSAILGTLVLTAFGKMTLENVPDSIPHWWLGNALGTIVITPVVLLLVSWSRWREQQSLEAVESEAKSMLHLLRRRWLEIGLVLIGTTFFAFLTVQATKISIFATLQFAWLGVIPVFWAVARFGVAGSVLTASFSVVVTLLAYLMLYPNAITLPAFPVSPELLYTHKFSLLLQCTIALLAGTAITERSAAQVALEVEQIKRAETETRAQLSEELLKVNHLLNETNQQLQASEERFRTSVENMLDCFGVYSAVRNEQGEIVGFRVEYVNNAAQLNHQLSHDSPTASELHAVLPGHQNSDLFHEYCQVVETGQPLIRDSLIYEEQSGKRRLARAFDIRAAKLGNGFVATWRDITDLKQIESSLRQANEQFRLASEAVNSVIYDWDLQRSSIQRTSGMDRMFGYTPEEIEPTAEWYMALVHPADRSRVMDEVQAAFNSGSRYSLEYRIRNRQGNYLHVADQGLIIRDASGAVIRVVGSVADMSERARLEAERKQVELELQESEERLRMALNATDQGLYDLDIQTGEVIVSPEYARMLGYNPENFRETYQSWCERLHPDEREAVEQAYQDYIAGDRSEYRIEFRLRTQTGNWIWILSVGRVVAWDVAGTPQRMIGTHTDITDRKAIETERARLLEREQAARHQAESASRMKDEFLAIVSHELRSPLNGILGWSRLLRTRTLDANTTEKALASIERNAQAQTQLIEDLLDISRIIRGTVRLNLRPVNLIPIIQASLDTVGPTAEAKSIQLHAQLESDMGLVSGDSERLQQVVWNLLSNAIKFTAAGGSVEIHLHRVDDYARIQVVDTGKGISSEFLPYVFDRFRQADSTTTRTQGGLGLGLAIVRSLVELHGGSIWAESAGEGQGATFSVELPLLPQDSQQTNANFVPTALADSTSLKQVRVLIVDDEADTRDFLIIALEQFGATVTAAASAAEALQKFQQDPPDVLLSDIGMPEESGYMLIRKIRALPPEQGGRVPAAAITAYVRGDDRLEALKAGFQMHIAKPIEPIQLIRVVSQLATLQKGRT